MEEGAVRLAKLVGYHSTGTVEYLYNPTEETFCSGFEIVGTHTFNKPIGILEFVM